MSVVMTTPLLVVFESCNCFRHFVPFLLNCFVCFDSVPYTSHHRDFLGEEAAGMGLGANAPSILERTVAIIKPDAIQNQKEIEAIMIRSGFSILRVYWQYNYDYFLYAFISAGLILKIDGTPNPSAVNHVKV